MWAGTLNGSFQSRVLIFLLEKQSLESDGGSPAGVHMQSIWN